MVQALAREHGTTWRAVWTEWTCEQVNYWWRILCEQRRREARMRKEEVSEHETDPETGSKSKGIPITDFLHSQMVHAGLATTRVEKGRNS
jgi:hypothetical protein